ncbi:DUF3618 domain-containing protein [Streptomyces sp. NPDC056891]|uniref:DUF3618 domain-containing protein n=1 Tax=unclassified Streptomyces TaxID=2593676 RepID=UPI0036CA235D
MRHQPRGDTSEPSAEELRRMVAHAREKLGQPVEALAARADVKAQAMEKAADLRTHGVATGAAVTGQLRETAEHTARLAKDKTPDPAVVKAAHSAAQLGGTTARAGQLAAERTPDLVADKVGQGTAAARAYRTPCSWEPPRGVLLLVRWSRRQR